MKQEINYSKGIFYLLLCMCILAVGTVLKLTAPVVLPVAVAVLLSFVFQPVVATLNRKFRIPAGVGIAIVIIILISVIVICGNLLFSSIKTILTLYPKYEERFMIVYEAIADIFHLPFDGDTSLFENLWSQLGIRSAIQTTAITLSNQVIKFLRNLTVVFLFVIFLLAEMGAFKSKALVAFAGKDTGKITSIIKDIILQVTRYISVKFFISLLTGILVFLGTFVVGMDFPIIWGFIAFLLNFIPNFGSIISGIGTTLFALIQFWPKPAPVIWVAFVMLSVNMVLGNFIEPKIQGRNLGLSPFIIIVSLSIWGWIWGFMGMILAVPVMVILKITCENISFLQPLSLLMGSKSAAEQRQEKTDRNHPADT